MSLINNMLHDLEDRQAFVAMNDGSLISDLQSSEEFVTVQRPPYFRLLTSVIIVLSLLLIYLSYEVYFRTTITSSVNGENSIPASVMEELIQDSSFVDNSIIETTQVETSDLANKVIDLKLATSNLPEQETGQIKLQSALDVVSSYNSTVNNKQLLVSLPELTDIKIKQLAGATIISLKLSASPEYRLFTLRQPDRLLVEIKSLSIAPEVLSKSYNNNMIDNLSHREKIDTGQLIFNLKQSVVVSSSGVKADSGTAYSLDIELFSTAATITSTDAVESQHTNLNDVHDTGDVVKVAHITASVNTTEDKLFDDSLLAYRSGDVVTTIDLLYRVLAKQADHHKARELLVSILLEQGDRKAVKAMLHDGLSQDRSNIAFIKLYAKLLFEENQLDSALNYLKRVKPEISDEPEYYVLLAAILQRNKDYVSAVKIYTNLVQHNSRKGLWWMGLAISLESLGRHADAIRAYRSAQQDNSVSADISSFVDKRIRSLSRRRS